MAIRSAKKKKLKSAGNVASEFLARVKAGEVTDAQLDSVGRVITRAFKRTMKSGTKKGGFKFGQEFVIKKGLTAVEKSKRKAAKKK